MVWGLIVVVFLKMGSQSVKCVCSFCKKNLKRKTHLPKLGFFNSQQWGTLTMERAQPAEEPGEEGAVARRGISAQVEDFLEQVEKFINNLMTARNNMEGQVALAENGVGPIIDTVKTPADYQDAGEGVLCGSSVS